MDPYKIIIKPLISEKDFELIEKENKLVIQVALHATKHQIKESMEKLYDVQVLKVNTLITPKGTKKAYVKLSEFDDAADIASRMGLF
ncbi:MAG: 50S ribosomal protein L23 [Candidatus Heimdallarchaeota archaeon]|nr:50S ribosomal protein L23 [Candidatus Heimdallarchaeota archaeon]MCK4972145.1 50S ribosomal protein L23 [Candidatus Heimdallarchaeota archaeon]